MTTEVFDAIVIGSGQGGSRIWEAREAGNRIRAESAKMCPAAGMSDWIFHQEKSNFPNAGSAIPMLILL